MKGDRHSSLFRRMQASGPDGRAPRQPATQRPHYKRALGAITVALGCLAAGNKLGDLSSPGAVRVAADLGLTLGFVVFAAIGVRAGSREIGRISQDRLGLAAASGLRTLSAVIGYVLLILGLLQLLGVDMASLLVGGVVTGIVLSIAAQQVLGGFFAGLVLQLSRPYVVGDRVRILSPGLGGPLEGVVRDADLIYTTIATDEGLVRLPNAGLLAAAISPVPEPHSPVIPVSAIPG